MSLIPTGQVRKDDSQLYQRQSRVRPVRAAEYVAGAGALAWGGSRLGMPGRALARGARFATEHRFDRSADVLTRAVALRGAAQRGTRAPAQNLRRVQALNAAIERVPAKQRPMVATAAGALLMSNATPVRRPGYKPAQARPMTPGW